MNDSNKGTTTSVGPKTPVTNTTIYYTINGKHDFLNDDKMPCQNEENKFTYAKKTGQRRLIKLDKFNEPCNPGGMYYQPASIDRYVQVEKLAFEQYLLFLKTKNDLFYRQCIRMWR